MNHITLIDIFREPLGVQFRALLTNSLPYLTTLLGVYLYWRFDQSNIEIVFTVYAYFTLISAAFFLGAFKLLDPIYQAKSCMMRLSMYKVETLVRMNHLLRVALLAYIGMYHVAILWGIASYLQETIIDKGKPVLDELLKEQAKNDKLKKK